MPAQGKLLALTFLVSMMPSVSALQLDCGPGAEAEEKTQHSLTCEGLQADDTIYWTKYDRNLGKITVATCDATGSCQTNFSTRYDVKRPNNVTSTLKILDVKRDDTFVEGEWSCVSRSNETASCYVTVVFLPHVGECTVGFNEQSGQVTGRCEMHKVYPSPTCNWYERLEGQETDIPSNQTILTLTQYVDSSSSQIYFRGECMLKRPLPVTAGSYSYQVLIIPGLVEPLVDFTTTKRVAVPAPPVLRNCPQDYVTDVDASSCTCATSDLGSPQGSIAWYDPNKNVVLRNTSLILALPFSRVTAELNGQTYRCGVVHHTGSLSVDYVPKIAASPNKPKLSGYDKNKEYKVGETITLQCSAAGGRPDVNRVYLQCAGRPDEADSHLGGSVISRLSFTLKESDNNGECECYATNGVLNSERVTQRINERVTSGKGSELEVWYVALPVAVVAAVVVGVLAYTSRKRMYCRSRDPATNTLLGGESHGGSATSLNADSLPNAKIGDRHSPMGSPASNSLRREVTQSHYSVSSEVYLIDHVYDKLEESNPKATNKATPASFERTPHQRDSTTPEAPNHPPAIDLSNHPRCQERKDGDNLLIRNSFPTSVPVDRLDQADEIQDQLHGRRDPDITESSITPNGEGIAHQEVNGPSGANASAAKGEQHKMRSSLTGNPAVRQCTTESPHEESKHTHGMHDSGAEAENTQDANDETLHDGTKEEELDKPQNAVTDLAETPGDKPAPAVDRGRPYTQDGETPVIETAAADSGRGVMKTPSLKQQERRLSSGYLNSSSDKQMDNSQASESPAEVRIIDEDQASRDSQGDDESNVNTQNDSDPVGQQDQPHHKDGPPSPSCSASPVPPVEKVFVAAPKSMHTNQPENDKEPASTPWREHLVK